MLEKLVILAWRFYLDEINFHEFLVISSLSRLILPKASSISELNESL